MKINFNNKNIHIAATTTARVTNDNDDKDSNDDEEKKAYLDFLTYRNLRGKHEFFDASSHLYKRVCPSVRPSVNPSVRPSVRLSVRPSVRWSVRNPFFSNSRNRLFPT